MQQAKHLPHCNGVFIVSAYQFHRFSILTNILFCAWQNWRALRLHPPLLLHSPLCKLWSVQIQFSKSILTLNLHSFRCGIRLSVPQVSFCNEMSAADLRADYRSHYSRISFLTAHHYQNVIFTTRHLPTSRVVKMCTSGPVRCRRQNEKNIYNIQYVICFSNCDFYADWIRIPGESYQLASQCQLSGSLRTLGRKNAIRNLPFLLMGSTELFESSKWTVKTMWLNHTRAARCWWHHKNIPSQHFFTSSYPEI